MYMYHIYTTVHIYVCKSHLGKAIKPMFMIMAQKQPLKWGLAPFVQPSFGRNCSLVFASHHTLYLTVWTDSSLGRRHSSYRIYSRVYKSQNLRQNLDLKVGGVTYMRVIKKRIFPAAGICHFRPCGAMWQRPEWVSSFLTAHQHN